MPIDVTTTETAAIDLDEFVERVIPVASRLDDEDTLASLAPSIIQLANNRTFLGDLLVAHLMESPVKSFKSVGATLESYTSHVVMLKLDRLNKFIIRAAIWPSAKDYVYKINGDKEFSFNYPHDHNFGFLTVGYFGPGYDSDFYEIDPDSVIGVSGEEVKLKYIDRSRLNQGRSLVYRAHRDVHVQHPPEDLSISINLIGSGISAGVADQYIFDVERSVLKKVVSQGAGPVLLDIAMAMGGQKSHELVREFAAGHPIDSVRYRAARALARSTSTECFEEFIGRAAGDRSSYFRAMASNELMIDGGKQVPAVQNRSDRGDMNEIASPASPGQKQSSAI